MLLSFFMGWVMGFEPTNTGTTIRCLRPLGDTHHILFAEKVARQKGLAQSRSGSVKPSPATLTRVAFSFFESTRTSKKVARQKGLEPLTYCLEGSCSIQLSYWRISLERVTGIGPAYPAWKAGVLPLNYTRKSRTLWAFSYKILA